MVGPVKTRLACDRCHGQKLRCPKQTGSRICTRCERAGVACIFSPIGGPPRVGQNGQSFNYPASSMFGSADLNAGDWPMQFDNSNGAGTNGNVATGFNLEGLMQMTGSDGSMFMGDAANLFAGLTPGMDTQSPNYASNTNVGVTPGTVATETDSRNPTSTGGQSPKTAANDSTTDILSLSQRLAKLVADADLLYVALPNESAMHAPLEDRTEDGGINTPFLAYVDRPDYSPEKFAKKEFLERVFDITQRLSNAYADATPRTDASTETGGDEVGKCEFDNCLHSITLPGSLSTLETAFRESGLSEKSAGLDSGVDPAVAALLMAAHTRLLDVLTRILNGIFTCYKLRVATSTLDDAEMQLPDLTIGGSFVPPKSSAALVHAFLLRHLLDGLQASVERFLKVLRDGDRPNGSKVLSTPSLASRELHIVALQFSILKERHDETLKHLVSVGTDLASTGLIK
ncbi:hypothetical protein SEUCBS140593_009318 [Sporothrix eucalyptigena]|uniref:Zn(2)-C6 fungal-type domain-containing protein n=1 Tax=Sporothrix eucalyptigena TaxID=1812306 RepID=A0ABP0CWJ5_9PEZI